MILKIALFLLFLTTAILYATILIAQAKAPPLVVQPIQEEQLPPKDKQELDKDQLSPKDKQELENNKTAKSNKYHTFIPLEAVVTELPGTFWDFLTTSFAPDTLPWWGVIITSTAITWYYDEKMLLYAQKQGRDIGIGNDDNTETLYNIGKLKFRFPTDTGSALYFLGDGWVHIGNALAMTGYGYFSDTALAYNTGLQIIHGLAISTIVTQSLKISTGRESPFLRTQERGAWRPFPNAEAYGNDTARYDAMPSGHVAATTVTFTVLLENYPRYSYITIPVASVWITALAWQMMNNGVHWASDYPLALGIGYMAGKLASRLGEAEESARDAKDVSWLITPSVGQDSIGMNFNLFF